MLPLWIKHATVHIIKDTSIRSFQNAFLTTVPLNLDKYINEWPYPSLTQILHGELEVLVKNPVILNFGIHFHPLSMYFHICYLILFLLSYVLLIFEDRLPLFLNERLKFDWKCFNTDGMNFGKVSFFNSITIYSTLQFKLQAPSRKNWMHSV